MDTLSALFVSHGSPMLALNAGQTGAAWQSLVAGLPKPKAILVLSAHWLTPAPQVSATARPKTIHDFGGFPRNLYTLQYPAPGAPKLAGEVAALLNDAGFAAGTDPERGLDHGAWVPLRLMFPAADIPVLQLSLQPQFGPDYHYRLGQALAPLRAQGVLLLGSGSLTHNLFEVQWNVGDDESAVPEYVYAFQHWMHEKLLASDTTALLAYRRQAPEAARAHPTEEHLLPLFAMLGAGADGQIKRLHAGITEGVLAMDIYSFG